jgi:hypothetical protein
MGIQNFLNHFVGGSRHNPFVFSARITAVKPPPYLSSYAYFAWLTSSFVICAGFPATLKTPKTALTMGATGIT